MNKRQKIIGITGMPGVGKSTLGRKLGERLDTAYVELSELLFTNLFEQCLYTPYGDGSDAYEILKENCKDKRFGGLFRKFLQDLGAKSREVDPNILLDSMTVLVKTKYDYIFGGVRDKEHAEYILDQGGVLFHILPGDFYKVDDRVADHKVEVSVPYPGSCIITNNNIITSVNEMLCYLEGFYGQD